VSVLGLQSDADMDEDFSFLQPLDLITKEPNELHNIVKAKKENLRQHKSESNKIVNGSTHDNARREHVQEREKERKEKENEQRLEKIRLEKEKEQPKDEYKETQHTDQNQNHTEKHEDKTTVENLNNRAHGGKYYCIMFYLVFFPLAINLYEYRMSYKGKSKAVMHRA